VDPDVVHCAWAALRCHEFSRPFPCSLLADVIGAAEGFLEVEKDSAPPVHARWCGLSCRHPRVEQGPGRGILPGSGCASLKPRKLRRALVRPIVAGSKTLEANDRCDELVEHAVEKTCVRLAVQHDTL